jgi:hypothetical protein
MKFPVDGMCVVLMKARCLLSTCDHMYNNGRLFGSKSNICAYCHTNVRTFFLPPPEEFPYHFFEELYNVFNNSVLIFCLVASLMMTTWG